MEEFIFNEKVYKIDFQGFLINHELWDENFALGMADKLRIPDGLTEKHWEVIKYIRDSFLKYNFCPNIYRTGKELNMKISDFKALFPTGYQRGACLLAGITYSDGYLTYHYIDKIYSKPPFDKKKVYRIDIYGFLVEPEDWDENFAVLRSEELKMPELLTDKHWEVIYFIRDRFKKTRTIPNVYETCEYNELELEQLEHLFPDGYHRGAVKLAGLRLIVGE